jgi:hypothetical protein
MHGGDPEVDRVTEPSCWKIANALIERRSVMESRPVFTNPVHLDVKPAIRELTPNFP